MVKPGKAEGGTAEAAPGIDFCRALRLPLEYGFVKRKWIHSQSTWWNQLEAEIGTADKLPGMDMISWQGSG